MSDVAAAAEVALVLRGLGVTVEVAVDPPALVLPSGQQVRVIEYASPSHARLQALVADEAVTSPALLLTNYLRRSFRRLLADAGWGWLDRTGHLNLPPLGLDQRIEKTLGPDPLLPDLWQRPRTPAAALALLRRGTDTAPTTRDLSYYAGISPAAAAHALNDLRTLGLIDGSGRPDPAALLSALAATGDLHGSAWPPHPPVPGSGRTCVRC